jgi:hypothetical protein
MTGIFLAEGLPAAGAFFCATARAGRVASGFEPALLFFTRRSDLISIRKKSTNAARF